MNPFERALELAERGRGKVEDHPLVGAVLVHGDEVVGEGWYEYAKVDHAEAIALAQAGERARGATLYVTLEPCNHSGRTPPCSEAVIAAGVARVVVGARDPNPKAAGGIERLREAGVEVELLDSWAARVQNEAWRTWKELGRPFVTYKVAVSLDGRVVVPGRRWVSGEESRRRVHELRAASDAVAVGMGTVRADNPRLDARDVDATKQPRRLAFGRGPCRSSRSSSGPLEDELRALAAEGVQSLLLEGGPTLATAFLARRASSTSCSSSSRPCSPARGRGFLGDLPEPVAALASDRAAVGRGRAARSVRPRAVAFSSCSPGIVRELGRVVVLRRRAAARRGSADGRRARRLGRDRRRLPDRRRARRRPARVRRRRETLDRTTLGALTAAAGQRRAGAARRRAARRPHRPGPRRRRRPRAQRLGSRVWIDAPPEVLRYCVEKGSIAVDGVSLTVAALDDAGFAVALVPHTLAVTTLGAREPGTAVNLEVDVLAKYVERLTMGAMSVSGDRVRDDRGCDRGHPRRASSSWSSTRPTARTKAT